MQTSAISVARPSTRRAATSRNSRTRGEDVFLSVYRSVLMRLPISRWRTQSPECLVQLLKPAAQKLNERRLSGREVLRLDAGREHRERTGGIPAQVASDR